MKSDTVSAPDASPSSTDGSDKVVAVAVAVAAGDVVVFVVGFVIVYCC